MNANDKVHIKYLINDILNHLEDIEKIAEKINFSQVRNQEEEGKEIEYKNNSYEASVLTEFSGVVKNAKEVLYVSLGFK